MQNRNRKANKCKTEPEEPEEPGEPGARKVPGEPGARGGGTRGTRGQEGPGARGGLGNTIVRGTATKRTRDPADETRRGTWGQRRAWAHDPRPEFIETNAMDVYVLAQRLC